MKPIFVMLSLLFFISFSSLVFILTFLSHVVDGSVQKIGSYARRGDANRKIKVSGSFTCNGHLLKQPQEVRFGNINKKIKIKILDFSLQITTKNGPPTKKKVRIVILLFYSQKFLFPFRKRQEKSQYRKNRKLDDAIGKIKKNHEKNKCFLKLIKSFWSFVHF